MRTEYSIDQTTETSNRATHLLNPRNLWRRLAQRLQRPVHTDAIAQQLEMLVHLKRLELLIGLEDKDELTSYLNGSLNVLKNDLSVQQTIGFLTAIIEQRSQRLNGEFVEIRQEDLLPENHPSKIDNPPGYLLSGFSPSIVLTGRTKYDNDPKTK